MRTKPTRILTTLLAVMLCMAAFSISALAVNDTATASTVSTPDGTGTVVSDTTNGDGKEFLTIKTSDDHVFYLIIDKQKTSNNVYFLDAVTTKDLLSLAQSDGGDSGSSTTTGATKNTQTSDALSTPKAFSTAESSSAPNVSTPAVAGTSQTGKQNNTAKVTAVVILSAVIAGAVILFFKLRKPNASAKNEKDTDEYDFLEDEDTDDKSAPQEETEAPDEETEDDE